MMLELYGWGTLMPLDETKTPSTNNQDQINKNCGNIFIKKQINHINNKTFVFVQTFNKLGHSGLCGHKIII